MHPDARVFIQPVAGFLLLVGGVVVHDQPVVLGQDRRGRRSRTLLMAPDGGARTHRSYTSADTPRPAALTDKRCLAAVPQNASFPTDRTRWHEV